MWIIKRVDDLRLMLEAIQAWVFLLSLLLLLPLLALRKTRAVASVSLIWASIFWGLLLWAQSFLYLYRCSGWLWIIWGTLLGGVGIIPIAWVTTLLRADWISTALISGGLVWIFGTRLLAFKAVGERAKKG